MAEIEKKFKIEIFRKKEAEELTAALADPNGKLELGSAAALAGADACAMALRGARLASVGKEGDERMDFLLRNLDKLRSYLVYLIDEDVKGQNILRRARKENDPQKLEAARQSACAISDEVICQIDHLVELIDEVSTFAPVESMTYLGAALEMALSAFQSARLYVVNQSRQSIDETYAFVVRRENELRWENLLPRVEQIRSRVEKALR